MTSSNNARPGKKRAKNNHEVGCSCGNGAPGLANLPKVWTHSTSLRGDVIPGFHMQQLERRRGDFHALKGPNFTNRKSSETPTTSVEAIQSQAAPHREP